MRQQTTTTSRRSGRYELKKLQLHNDDPTLLVEHPNTINERPLPPFCSTYITFPRSHCTLRRRSRSQLVDLYFTGMGIQTKKFGLDWDGVLGHILSWPCERFQTRCIFVLYNPSTTLFQPILAQKVKESIRVLFPQRLPPERALKHCGIC